MIVNIDTIEVTESKQQNASELTGITVVSVVIVVRTVSTAPCASPNFRAPEVAAQRVDVATGLDRRSRDHDASALTTNVREAAAIAVSAHASCKVPALCHMLIVTLDIDAAAFGERPAGPLDVESGLGRHLLHFGTNFSWFVDYIYE